MANLHERMQRIERFLGCRPGVASRLCVIREGEPAPCKDCIHAVAGDCVLVVERITRIEDQGPQPKC